jgi:hypothetical protein
MGLDETATVYVQGTVVKTNLACRMTHIQSIGNARDRAELAAMRRLLFDPSYTMPEYAQIAVANRQGRWNVRSGTIGTYHGPLGQDEFSRCDLIRAANAP